jgi:hypothetical protein
LRANVRVEPGSREDRAYLWLRVLREGQPAQAFYENMVDHPIVSPDWMEYRIPCEVPEDATRIEFGLAFAGDGHADIDGVVLEVGER